MDNCRRLSLFSNDGTKLVDLTPPTSEARQGSTNKSYIYTPATPFTLDAYEYYWIVVKTGGASWGFTDEADDIIAAGWKALGDLRYRTDGGSTWDNLHPDEQARFRIHGTANGNEVTVTGASVSSSPAANGYYAVDENITIAVTTSNDVAVTGSPTFAFSLGDAVKQAAYQAGSDANVMTFSYTVATGDEDLDGISWGANAITVPSGGSVTLDGHSDIALTTDHDASDGS